MQLNINIEDKNIQEQISQYISDKKQKADKFVIETLKFFFQKEALLSAEEIQKIVENSQGIESYTSVSGKVTA